MKLSDLPNWLPLFPLPNALLFPRSTLPLHVFEPRYLELIEDCLKTSHRLIGIIQTEGDDLRPIGCAGRLTSFTETDDGRYLVSLTGVSRFELNAEVETNTPYRRFNVDWTYAHQDMHGTKDDPDMNRTNFIELLKRYFEIEDLQTDWDNLHGADDELLINSISMLCPFSSTERQALLEAQSLSSRREILEATLEIALHGQISSEIM